MLAIAKVTIERAEGPNTSDFSLHTFEGVDAETRGNQFLREISETAPREGGYDKCDVVITFADGFVWEARFDVKHFSCEDADLDLRQHVRDFLFFHLNPERIAWIQAELTSTSWVKRDRGKEHLANLRRMLSADDRKAYAEFLARLTGELTPA